MPRNAESLCRLFPVLRRVEALANLPSRGRVPQDKQELASELSRPCESSSLVSVIVRRSYCTSMTCSGVTWTASRFSKTCCGRQTHLDFSCCSANGTAARRSFPRLAQLETAAASSGGYDVRRVGLEPMPDSDVVHLAESLLGAEHPASEPVIRSLVSGAAGNPYFLESLVRHHQVVGTLPAGGPSSPTVTLEQVLLAQMEALECPGTPTSERRGGGRTRRPLQGCLPSGRAGRGRRRGTQRITRCPTECGTRQGRRTDSRDGP